jgi:hypothetical protein
LSKHREVAGRLALCLLVAVLLPNLFLFAAAWHYGFGRPYVNLDYILAFALFCGGWRLLGIGALLSLMLLDVLTLVGQLFVFVRLQDLSYFLSLVPYAPLAYQTALAGLLVLILAVCWVYWRTGSKTMLGAALLVLNIGVLFYLYEVNFNASGNLVVWNVKGHPLVSSQAVNFYDARPSGLLADVTAEGEVFSVAKSERQTESWQAGAADRPSKLLLVVNESWGVANEAAIHDAIIEPLTRIPGLRELRQGGISFAGATVSAELRELCGLHANHFNLSGVDQELAGCLPQQLKAEGYRTTAIHGAAGMMYDRVRWYPKAGFEQLVFLESRPWPRRCYSFPGACDMDLMDEVRAGLTAEGKSFVYWLTLNTHSNFDLRDLQDDHFDCAAFGIESTRASCRNFKLQAQFFNGLAELLADKALQDMEVIVVGDHPPPILNREDFDQYFQDARVPWVRLTK